MSTRVIHSRIKDTTLAGCYDVLEGMGSRKVDGLAMAAAVSQALDALIAGLRRQSMIPEYTSGEAADRLADLLDIEPSIDLGDVKPVFEDVSDEESDEPSASQLLRNHIDSLVEDKSDGKVETKLTVIDAPAETGQTEQAIDFSKSKRIPFEKLKLTCPKDRLVEEANNNEALQKSLEVVYAALPTDMWGSSKAEELVRKVYNQYLKYGLGEDDESGN